MQGLALTGLDAAGQPSVEDQLANDQAIIAAAQARIDELRRQRADFPGAPPFDRSNLEDKLKNYALNPDNPGNGGKAYWFKQVLGFDQSNWKELADQIYFDESAVTKLGKTADGQLYRQLLRIKGANGNATDVKFGFIKAPNGVVRLVSAIPGRKK